MTGEHAPASRLSGKVALVSGSDRGIGRAIACKLEDEDARVFVNDIDEVPVAAAHATGGYSYQQIRAYFGVHFTTVAKVERRAKSNERVV